LASRLTQSIGDVAAYSQVLDDYVKEFPESSASRDIARVTTERTVWEGLSALNQMFDPWRENLFDLEHAQAADRLRQCREFLQQHTDAPHTEDIRSYCKILEAITRRESAEGARSNLLRLLSDVFVSNLWLVRTRAGDCYYLREEPAETAKTSYTVKYIADNDGTEKGKLLYAQDIDFRGPAPQSELAKIGKRAIDDLRPETWEAVAIQIVALIRNDKGIDPILQLLLVEKILQYGIDGSYALELALKKDRDILRDAASELSSARWMDPLNQDAKRARVQAREVIAKVRDFTQIRVGIKEPLEKLGRELVKKPEWIGWLTHDEQGKWVCSMKHPPTGTSSLWVVARVSDGGYSWRQVGACDGEKADVNAVNITTGLVGRPIFALKVEKP
jgi:hypothetical protein